MSIRTLVMYPDEAAGRPRGGERADGTTVSCYARGLDAFNGANQLLDRTPKGRDEGQLPAPVAWLRRHDEYEPAAVSAG